MTQLRDDPWFTLRRICDGNRRFVELGEGLPCRITAPHERLVVVTCSDLHASLEPVLGLAAHEALVAQTPGPFVGSAEFAAVSYGVRVLGVRLILVVAHEGCQVLGAGEPRSHSERAVVPGTSVEWRARQVCRRARQHGQDVPAHCARYQCELIEREVALPEEVILQPAVLRADGRLSLVAEAYH